jgi:hypothetical protein
MLPLMPPDVFPVLRTALYHLAKAVSAQVSAPELELALDGIAPHVLKDVLEDHNEGGPGKGH